MALAARIESVEYTVETVDASGASETVDLSLNGNLLVVVDYVDDATPNDVIHTERFIVSSVESEAQIQERITAFGARVREARVRTAALASYIGTLIPVPEVVA